MVNVLRKGYGTINEIKLRETASQIQGINLDILKKQLGFDNTTTSGVQATKEKFISLYGGGEKGREAYANLKRFINVLDQEYTSSITDPSKFVARRLTLAGFGGGALLGAYISPGAATDAAIPLALIMGYGGYIFSNPQLLKSMLDIMTTSEKIESAYKLKGTKMQMVAKLLNNFIDEEKDQPRINVNKVTEEEITNYLMNKQLIIPNYKFNVKDLSPKVRSQYFPELKIAEKMTPEEIVLGENYLRGSSLARNQVIEYKNIINNPQSVANQQPLTPPPQIMQPQQAAQIRNINPATAQALFPNDSILNLYAQRQV